MNTLVEILSFLHRPKPEIMVNHDAAKAVLTLRGGHGEFTRGYPECIREYHDLCGVCH